MFRSEHEPEELEVFRVVNVAEHPDLQAPALSGALHRLDDGESVEVPFIYHDPDARMFVLVIPAGARGRELSERAKLLDELMGGGLITLEKARVVMYRAGDEG